MTGQLTRLPSVWLVSKRGIRVSEKTDTTGFGPGLGHRHELRCGQELRQRHVWASTHVVMTNYTPILKVYSYAIQRSSKGSVVPSPTA